MSVYERSPKNSHLDTIRYEIAMTAFCYSRLLRKKKRFEPETNLLIEGFLLHYRNLVEFFSGKRHRKARNCKPADLSTADPVVWASRRLTNNELIAMQNPAMELDTAYYELISQFLQHCTERRLTEFRNWNVSEMFERLKPIVLAFHRSFPGNRQIRCRTPR